ncbi:MAG: hypothetical protein ACRDOO_13870 [Actinomadura sp.]
MDQRRGVDREVIRAYRRQAPPYLVVPDHTRHARDLLGPGTLLAPEHKVIVSTDVDHARAIGRDFVASPYLGLRNYVNNLLRHGFTPADIADRGSDTLIDALVLHGTPKTIATGLTAHLEAGADHVGVQVLVAPGHDPMPGYRQLAKALFQSPAAAGNSFHRYATPTTRGEQHSVRTTVMQEILSTWPSFGSRSRRWPAM